MRNHKTIIDKNTDMTTTKFITDTVIIEGKHKGDIIANKIIITGEQIGDMKGRVISILKGAVVEGKIEYYENIKVEEGEKCNITIKKIDYEKNH